MAQRTYDGTLQFNKSYSEEDAAKRGKNPNISPTVTCTDVKSSTVLDDHETTNDLNIRYSVNVSKKAVDKTPSTVTG